MRSLWISTAVGIALTLVLASVVAAMLAAWLSMAFLWSLGSSSFIVGSVECLLFAFYGDGYGARTLSDWYREQVEQGVAGGGDEDTRSDRARKARRYFAALVLIHSGLTGILFGAVCLLLA